VNSVSTVAVEDDGKIGPVTLAAVNAADQDALLNAYRLQRASYYNQIVEKHPGDEKYLSNWLARAQA
jgi:lysozyme family protein